MIWTMGMGKSSVAARLLALDLCTMGVPAAFIEGGQILHGGIGGIKPEDTVYFFSESGETRELVEAANIIRENAKAVLLYVGLSPNSSLAKLSGRSLGPFEGNVNLEDPMTWLNGTSTMKMILIARRIAFEWWDYSPGADWAHPANRGQNGPETDPE